MDKTVKTLIIIVVILVALLGAAGGFILQSYLTNMDDDPYYIVDAQINNGEVMVPTVVEVNASTGQVIAIYQR